MCVHRVTLRQIMLSLVFCTELITQARAQVIGKIIDKNTELPIPFASIIYQKQSSQKGTIANVHGKFEIDEPNITNFNVSCVGYKSLKVEIQNSENKKNITVALEPTTKDIAEIIVTPSRNPAIRIIENALSSKHKNNFENYEDYSFKCYIKTLLDVKLSENATLKDSMDVSKSKSLNKRAPFISECIITSLKLNKRVENKIIAQKTSGFENPLLVQSFVSMFHNSISFYNNSISLFELPLSNDKSATEYVGPLSDGCLSSYSYSLEDTYSYNQDSIFVVSFQPKRGQSFNALRGTLFISSNGFAIKTIVAEPTEKGLIVFKFRQDYQFINGKWFPTNLDEEIGFASMKIKEKSNAYPAYIISCRIDSIDYNPNIANRKINLEKIYIDKLSIQKSDLLLSSSRPDSLSLREKNSYHYMDSIGKKHNFDYWLKLYPKVMIGRIPTKWVDLDINDIYTYNKFEGNRLGIGLFSNEKLSNIITLGGFAGYGFNDKKMKYGEQIIFDINKYYEIQLKLSYAQNIKEVGSEINSYSGSTVSEYLRSYIGSRFDYYEQKKLEFGFRIPRFLKINSSININKVNPAYDYLYKGSPIHSYNADELKISAKYAHGEELETFGTQRFVNFEGNPIINLTYTRGINTLNNNSFQYNRAEATIDYTLYNGKLGQSYFRLASGIIDSSLPYGLLFTGEGSKSSDMPLLINNSFQTMQPYEFLSDRYVHLFYSHNFGSLLFKTKTFKPQFVIVHNSGWGSLANASYQGIDFKTKNKVYLESGLIVNNIIKLNYLNMFYFNFGVGGFYRYGNYQLDNFSKNLAVKLSMNISIK